MNECNYHRTRIHIYDRLSDMLLKIIKQKQNKTNTYFCILRKVTARVSIFQIFSAGSLQ